MTLAPDEVQVAADVVLDARARTVRRHGAYVELTGARRSFKHVRPAITLVAAPVRPATNPDHIQDGTFGAKRGRLAPRTDSATIRTSGFAAATVQRKAPALPRTSKNIREARSPSKQESGLFPIVGCFKFGACIDQNLHRARIPPLPDPYFGTVRFDTGYWHERRVRFVPSPGSRLLRSEHPCGGSAATGMNGRDLFTAARCRPAPTMARGRP